jgi:ABC-2 type transport system permease protein
MSVTSVTRLTLRQDRWSSIGWVAGIGALSLLYTASFKSIAGAKAAAINNYPDSIKQALNLQDLTSPAGYLASTVFGIPLLLLTSIYVITTTTRAIAGDEESGALDLLLSYPIGRTGFLLARFGAMGLVIECQGVMMLAVLAATRDPSGLSANSADVVYTLIMWLAFARCLGGIGLLVSATVGRRAIALAISAAIALITYLASSFLPLIKGLHWIREISPYYWFTGNDPLRNGLQVPHLIALIAVGMIATVLAAVAFNRRDLHA